MYIHGWLVGWLEQQSQALKTSKNKNLCLTMKPPHAEVGENRVHYAVVPFSFVFYTHMVNPLLATTLGVIAIGR